MQKIISSLFVLITLFSIVVSARPDRYKERALICTFNNGYFKVTDGLQKWEKYVTSADASNVLLECDEELGAAIIGSYFVTFYNGQFNERYVTTSNVKALRVRGNMAAAVIGSYLIISKAGGSILEKYVTTTDKVAISVNNDLVVAVVGSYFLVSEGASISERYVGVPSSAIPLVATGDRIGAAIMGSYFVSYLNGQVIEKYVGGSGPNDSLDAERTLVAGSVGNYFIVLDGLRNQFQEKYVGKSGQIQVRNGVAIHRSNSGAITAYSQETGTFRDL